jgi:hypothetical protein
MIIIIIIIIVIIIDMLMPVKQDSFTRLSPVGTHCRYNYI